MELLDADEISQRTPWPALIEAIAAELIADRSRAPERHVHPLDLTDGSTGSLLLMPAWSDSDLISVKVVTYFPSNAGDDAPTVNASLLLFDGVDGTCLATLDGDELTSRRTAACSALAAGYLARRDASRLLVVGTGRLAPAIARAHGQASPIESVEIWGRNAAMAVEVAAGLAVDGFDSRPVEDLRAGVARADIVSCVTGATAPIVAGEWLTAGTHLDLVGSFRPDMRETDDEALSRASLFVDTIEGAVRSGDLAQPLGDGVIARSDIRAELRDLVAGAHGGRTGDDEITVFKSAGFALADLAAAKLVWRSRADPGPGA